MAKDPVATASGRGLLLDAAGLMGFLAADPQAWFQSGADDDLNRRFTRTREAPGDRGVELPGRRTLLDRAVLALPAVQRQERHVGVVGAHHGTRAVGPRVRERVLVLHPGRLAAAGQ